MTIPNVRTALESAAVKVATNSSSASFCVFIFSSCPFVEHAPSRKLAERRSIKRICLLFIVDIFINRALLNKKVRHLIMTHLYYITAF